MKCGAIRAREAPRCGWRRSNDGSPQRGAPRARHRERARRHHVAAPGAPALHRRRDRAGNREEARRRMDAAAARARDVGDEQARRGRRLEAARDAAARSLDDGGRDATLTPALSQGRGRTAMKLEKRAPHLRLKLEGWRSRFVLVLVAAGFAALAGRAFYL